MQWIKQTVYPLQRTDTHLPCLKQTTIENNVASKSVSTKFIIWSYKLTGIYFLLWLQPKTDYIQVCNLIVNVIHFKTLEDDKITCGEVLIIIDSYKSSDY